MLELIVGLGYGLGQQWAGLLATGWRPPRNVHRGGPRGGSHLYVFLRGNSQRPRLRLWNGSPSMTLQFPRHHGNGGRRWDDHGQRRIGSAGPRRCSRRCRSEKYRARRFGPAARARIYDWPRGDNFNSRIALEPGGPFGRTPRHRATDVACRTNSDTQSLPRAKAQARARLRPVTRRQPGQRMPPS